MFSGLKNWIRGLLFPKESEMLQKISDLTQSVAALQGQVTASTANSQQLKTKLDAAIGRNAELEAERDAAQARALTPEDEAALDTAVAALRSASQTLSDATALTNPAN